MEKLIKAMLFLIPAMILFMWVGASLNHTEKGSIANTIDIIGNTTIDGDILLIDCMISPGCSPGKLNINGNFRMTSGASFRAELKDLSGAGTGHDQIDVSGNVSLNGALDILLDGYTPSITDQFEIIAYGGTLSGTFSTINWPASMSTWMIDYGLLNLGKVTIYGPDSPLPVELLRFSVVDNNSQHILTWQTASEISSDYFIIEHSKDASVFFPLGRMESNGMSTTIQNYSYTNESPSRGINYYRLKQVDIDGKYMYSNIISIHQDMETIVDFYPNPSSQILHFKQPVESVIIYNLLGKKVLKAINVGTELDISKMETGTYTIIINNGESRHRFEVNN